MAEVRREVDLADEPLPQQAGGDVGVQDLDRHPPVGVLLHGQEHPGHAAGADLPLHVIAVSEACTQGREHIEHERQVSHPRRRRRARGPRPPTGRFSRERYNFPMASAGLVQRSPYLRLVAYYLVLGLAVWLLIKIFPQIPQLLERFREVSVLGVASARRGRDLEQFTGAGAETLTQGELGVVTLLSMLAALLLVLPVAQVYMLTKQRSGYDQSVVQTVIILPMTVAATVILVQNSLALAFTLAAIVAAVRFRNTLKDTKDAVYIFLALAVGVAAGVFAPSVAAVMSVLFNVVVLALWRLNVGNIYADQRARTPSLPPAEALLGPRRRESAELFVGDPELLAALAPSELQEVAARAARLQAYVAARAQEKKEERFNGVLLVHTTQPAGAQRIVEELLQEQAVRWRLAEINPAGSGRSTLEFLFRLKEGLLPGSLLEALKSRGSPPIDAAEYRSLRGLKKSKPE